MFDQLKKAKKIRDTLSNEEVENEINGVKVKINGKMEIVNIELNSDLDLKAQEKALKKCINQALKKLKRNLASKMSQFKM